MSDANALIVYIIIFMFVIGSIYLWDPVWANRKNNKKK